MNKAPIKIFAGHFGSGKTEVAINFAINFKKDYNKVSIVDLDIVNPYFRTHDVVKVLEKRGIQVIASEFANTNIDIPALPSNIISSFEEKDSIVIFDVGGDDEGAKVLGRYNKYFLENEYEMFIVINTKRSLTGNVEQCIKMIEDIEDRARLKVTGLINNTNISYDSEVKHLIEGHEIIKIVSKETKIPIKYITGQKKILDMFPKRKDVENIPIDLYLQLSWDN